MAHAAEDDQADSPVSWVLAIIFFVGGVAVVGFPGYLTYKANPGTADPYTILVVPAMLGGFAAMMAVPGLFNLRQSRNQARALALLSLGAILAAPSVIRPVTDLPAWTVVIYIAVVILFFVAMVMAGRAVCRIVLAVVLLFVLAHLLAGSAS